MCLQLLPEQFGQVAALCCLREANIGLPTCPLDVACLTCPQTDLAPGHTITKPTACSLPRTCDAVRTPGAAGGGAASDVEARKMSAAGDIGGSVGGVVVRFERRVASLAVITKLVELGYLQPGARHRATAVERAIDRLRSNLIRQGVLLLT